jgi:hypothetical protein
MGCQRPSARTQPLSSAEHHRVAVGDGVTVGVGELAIATITSWGGLAPSRLEKLVLVPLVLVIPRLYVPLPVIGEVTFALVQEPVLTLPDDPSVGPIGGAVA